MAMVNFSVPDEVKHSFNQTFAGQNKSAIITGLMRSAVEDAVRKKQRQEAFRLLTEGRSERPALSDDELYRLRNEGRS